jgi:hypothetical protein
MARKRATQTRPSLACRRWPGNKCLSVPLRRCRRPGGGRGIQPHQYQTLARGANAKAGEMTLVKRHLWRADFDRLGEIEAAGRRLSATSVGRGR